MYAAQAAPLPRYTPQPHFKIHRLLWSLLLTLATGVLSYMPANAAPWIDANEGQTRHHLQNLIDRGVLNTPITSWPVMWAHIKQELDGIEPASLDKDELWSYQYLRHELRKAMRSISFQQTASIGNSVTSIGDFSANRREEHESGLVFNYTGRFTTLNLDINYVHEPQDDDRLRFDGSYWSFLAGNWAIGVGAIDRWWGPGWDSSLILSHNARPAPGIFIQRNSSTAFESPWLSWIGPWQLVTFMSQLESERHIPDARLWGMRLNIKPLRSLEIGFSRTAMWGGKGRPGDIETFVNLLLGNDNRGDAGVAEDGSNEPGNQLAGIDWRWSHRFNSLSTAFYGQLIGEDEAGGMPSRHIGMAGGELQTLWRDTQIRLSLETHNTTVYFYESDKTAPNVAYEHSIYQSGYRYHGRPIGASTDNDTEAYVLRSQFHFSDGDSLNLSYGRFHLNADGSTTGYRSGGSAFGSGETTTNRIQVAYTRPINSTLLLEVGAFHYSSAIQYSGEKISGGGHVSLRAYW
jgi:hypothetical protein